MTIRQYKHSDRVRIREIACNTADRGEPVENFFRDREFIADLLMNYYTDYEPSSTFVKEEANRITGYITGCLDTSKYKNTMALKIFPSALSRALFRKSFWNKQTYLLLLSLLKTWQNDGLNRDIPLDIYPAHLHINIDKNYRGQHTGQALIQNFLQYIKNLGIKGVHLSASGDNQTGRLFFEKMGFSLFKCYPIFMPNGGTIIKTTTAIYVKKL
jgi:GNAT superfamily N-acetyltransferase